MTKYYFPACKYSGRSPENTSRLKAYLADHFGVESTGCCSIDHSKPGAGDEALYHCPTCGLILAESSKAGRLRSVYEFLFEDEHFPWPDYGGEAMTVQDCWRTRENKAFLDAVRACLQKMNVKIIEVEQRYGKADYCGPALFRTPSERYVTLAPKSLVEKWCHHTLPEDEIVEKMQEYAGRWTTEKIVCTCMGCLAGVAMTEHTPVHLLDMVTSQLIVDN